MTHQVIGNDLVIKNDLVHVEFERSRMKTFVWLPNHGELDSNKEYMAKFFASNDEHAVRVEFDLFDDMVVPLIQGFEQRPFGSRILDREDEHIIVAMKNKLQKCIDEINQIKYINASKIEAASLVEKFDDIRNVKIQDSERFHQRIKNALKSGGVYTLGDLEKITLSKLISIANLGKKSRQEILDYMQANGLKLKSN